MIDLIAGWLTLLLTGDFLGYSILGVHEDSAIVHAILTVYESLSGAPAPHVEYIQPVGEYVEAVYAE